jgi:hypothetical protein
MKNAVFCDVAPCSPCEKLCFGGTCHLHLQVRKTWERGTLLAVGSQYEEHRAGEWASGGAWAGQRS